MADDRTSLSDNLIAAGLDTSNPTGTYTDFAHQIAKNQSDQAAQEQALELAKQHVAQAKISTKQATEADAEGVNPQLMDVMTPEQAGTMLHIISKSKGLDISDDEIAKFVDSLDGKPVNRQVVETFANRFSRESIRFGQPAQFSTTDDIAIPAGVGAEDIGLVADASNPRVGHVPSDGMYQVAVDNQGAIKKVVPGGKEPVDTTAKVAAKAADTANKRWSALDKEINIAFRTRSGGLGSLSTAIWRATRAINTIRSNPNLTAQDLENVSADIAGIFQGGAPTTETMKGNQYDLAVTNFENKFREMTGVMGSMHRLFGSENVDKLLKDTKDKLLQVLEDLRTSCVSSLQTYIESEKAGYEDIINADPEHWERMKKQKMNLVISGLIGPDGKPLVPQEAETELKLGRTSNKTPGDDTNAKKAVLPSSDDIDAEFARRKAKKS